MLRREERTLQVAISKQCFLDAAERSKKIRRTRKYDNTCSAISSVIRVWLTRASPIWLTTALRSSTSFWRSPITCWCLTMRKRNALNTDWILGLLLKLPLQLSGFKLLWSHFDKLSGLLSTRTRKRKWNTSIDDFERAMVASIVSSPIQNDSSSMHRGTY